MYCPACSADVTGGANFCLNCGEDLRHRSAVATPDETVAASEQEPAGPAAARADHAADDAADAADVAEADVAEVGASESRDDPTRVVPTFPSQPTPSGDDSAALPRCPACGAPNSHARVLCGRCGADLQTGERHGPVSVTPATEERGAREAAPGPGGGATTRGAERGPTRSTARTVGLVVLIGVLVGGGLGLLVISGLGPFASGDTAPPAPEFDSAVYPDEPTELEIASVTATSAHEPIGETRYEPGLVADGDPATAWNSVGDERPNGVGEQLTVTLAQPAWVTELVFANGYQKSDETFFENARIQRADLVFDGGATFDLALLDQQGQQSVELTGDPVLTTTVRLVVTEAVPGETYADLALSELTVKGHIAVGQDRDLAQRIARRDPTPQPSR